MAAKDKIKIELKSDGVYAIVDNSDEGAKPTPKDLLEIIKEYKIEQIDHNAINDIFKSTESTVEQKISPMTTLATKDEAVTVESSKSRMEGYIIFSPPEFGGKLLTEEEILAEIKKAGISVGIKEELIAEIVKAKQHKDYINSYTVAEGKEPIHGADGELLYNFDTSGEHNHPKILADGTVDYKQIDYFISVKAGTVLAVRTEPTEGESGSDVFGQPVSQKPGKPAPKFSKGKNTYISDDEVELIAQTSGQLVISGKTISVSPVLEIKGDVGYETGNIDFDGSVNIQGAVISGFSVEALGNIEVKGIVEASSLTAKGAINLYGGIQGRFKGRVVAAGNVFTKFAQNARIIAGGNITSNALLHCNIDCKGSILLEGDNCFIVGGTTFAGDEIRAKTIGSYMGTRTEVKVGGNPELSGRYDQVKMEYEELKKKFKKLNDDYEKIVQSGDVTKLDVKRKGILLQLINHRNAVKEEALALEKELTELVGSLRKSKGRIVAEKVIHHGSFVTISNASLQLHDDITVSVLKNVNGNVRAEPYIGTS